MKTVFIYALNEPCSGPDPTAGRTRYIGKAIDPYARYEKHLDSLGRERTHKAKWIRSLLKIGKTPILEILDEVPETEWAFWECEWIRLYRALGFRLTNGTDGGDGLKNPSDETREKIRLGNLGRKHSEATLAKLRAINLGKKRSPEVIAKMTGIKQSAETIAKRVLSRKGQPGGMLGKKHSAETRSKMSIAQTARQARAEHGVY